MRRSILALKSLSQLLILMSVIILIVPLNANSQSDSVWYPNRAQFYINPGLISMSQGVVGVIFDSTECDNCKQIYPAWRFLGDLKVDCMVCLDPVVLKGDS